MRPFAGVRLALLVLAGFGAIPTRAHAQSGIAGFVRDTTGGVLPGVTVEAASPALIEKVRGVVTDSEGLYRIVDLRPGTYSVTFTLPGFQKVVRQGIELGSNFTANINAEMSVGSVEETITVSGETPLVDVQGTQRSEVMKRDFLDALPTGRNFVAIGATLPGVKTNVSDVGGSEGMQNGTVTAYGSRGADMAMEIDGMSVMGLLGSGNCPCVYHNDGAYQDYIYQVAGADADSHTGGVRVNYIPKEGGNKFAGDVLGLYSGAALQSLNITDELRARGAKAPPELYRLYDVNASLGGPILRDRLWFFFSHRSWAYNDYVLNQFVRDGSQARDTNLIRDYTSRATVQVSPKNKVTIMFDRNVKNRQYFGIENGNLAPEAAPYQRSPRAFMGQAKWTSPLTSRLLLEAGYSINNYIGTRYQQPEVRGASPDDPYGALYGDIAKIDLVRGVTFNSAPVTFRRPFRANNVVASVSYVTGSHTLKVGFADRFGPYRYTDDVIGHLNQRYRNGVPDSVVVRNTPVSTYAKVNADLGVYVQDSWRIKRLTLNPGLRFEYFNAEVAEQSASAGRFVPERRFGRIPNLPNWKDITPRFGAAYDLFGNGKTAIKGSLGKYTEQASEGFPNRYNPMVTSTDVRTWTDLNGDDRAQENEIGPPTNRNFGIRRNLNPDPGLRRAYQILYNLSLDQQVLPRLGLSVAYYRRGYHQQRWTDNLATTPADYTLLTIADPRGNGQTLPVYNLSASKFGLVDELDANSEENKETYNGVDVSFSVRFANGGTVAGGTSTGRVRTVTCQVDDPNALRFCDQTEFNIPFRTSFKLSASYRLPFGWQASGVFQSVPGNQRVVSYLVNRTIVRNLTVPQVSIALNEPGSQFLERLNQLDLSVGREFRIGAVRLTPRLDLFNVLNASTILGEVTTFGPALGTVQQILPGRLLRLGAQLNL